MLALLAGLIGLTSMAMALPLSDSEKLDNRYSFGKEGKVEGAEPETKVKTDKTGPTTPTKPTSPLLPPEPEDQAANIEMKPKENYWVSNCA